MVLALRLSAGSNFLVRLAVHDQLQNLQFPLRQASIAFPPQRIGAIQLRIENFLSRNHAPDGGTQFQIHRVLSM